MIIQSLLDLFNGSSFENQTRGLVRFTCKRKFLPVILHACQGLFDIEFFLRIISDGLKIGLELFPTKSTDKRPGFIKQIARGVLEDRVDALDVPITQTILAEALNNYGLLVELFHYSGGSFEVLLHSPRLIRIELFGVFEFILQLAAKVIKLLGLRHDFFRVKLPDGFDINFSLEL